MPDELTQALDEIRRSAFVSGRTKKSYADANPQEAARVFAYLNGGTEPVPFPTTLMGSGLTRLGKLRAPRPPTPNVYSVPLSIDKTGASDVTAALQAWINGVPNGTAAVPNVLQFSGGTYKILTGLQLTSRSNLVFDGASKTTQLNQAAAVTFNAGTGFWESPDDHECLIRLDLCTNVTFRQLILHGSTTFPSSGDAHVPWQNLQWMHGVNIVRSTDIDVSFCTIDSFAGDGVCYGNEDQSPLGSGVVSDCDIRKNHRNGISYVGASQCQALRNAIQQSGFFGIDIEPNDANSPCDHILLDSNVFGTQGGALQRNCMAIGNTHCADTVVSNNSSTVRDLRMQFIPNQQNPHSSRLTITGNSSTVQGSNACCDIYNHDTVDVSGNSLPSSGDPFRFTNCTDVLISGSTYTSSGTTFR